MMKFFLTMAILAGVISPMASADARPYCWLDHYNNVRCSGF
jgi:hypothetical protein